MYYKLLILNKKADTTKFEYDLNSEKKVTLVTYSKFNKHNSNYFAQIFKLVNSNSPLIFFILPIYKLKYHNLNSCYTSYTLSAELMLLIFDFTSYLYLKLVY